tara:strand:+ start:338 stop:445 length:108 start_codon:yes stop_codon:yes gene_type:complete
VEFEITGVNFGSIRPRETRLPMGEKIQRARRDSVR